MEAKQGSDQAAQVSEPFEMPRRGKRGTAVRGTAGWDTAMERARQQAQSYARSLPPGEIAQGRPPFLVVVDVGYTIALYAEFTGTGGHYIPFPDASEAQKERIRALAEQLDAHRKRQQALHPGLTMTDMYNVLEKLRELERPQRSLRPLRSGEALTAKEKTIHEQGLVSILKQLHDDLDTAVFEAYGWPANLTDEEILERLVALNAERAAEEAQGIVRWLRPEYQAGAAAAPVVTQAVLIEAEEEAGVKVSKEAGEKIPWPAAMAEQAQAVRQALLAAGGPVTAKQVAAGFTGARPARVKELLETLVLLGQARQLAEGQFVGQ
jgi:hypothetical protein